MMEGNDIDRDRIRSAIHLDFFKTLYTVDGVGHLARFDVTIPGFLTIRNVKISRRADGELRLVFARLDCGDGFAVKMKSWFRGAIFAKAVTRLRSNDNGAPKVVAAKAEDTDEYTAGLARVLSKPRIAKSTWLLKTDEPWLPR